MNPIAPTNPVAGINPIAPTNPIAGVNPIASINPVAGTNPMAPTNPVGGTNFIAGLAAPDGPETHNSGNVVMSRFVVIARGGLKLRGGPSLDFDAIRTVPEGTVVNVLSQQDGFALVDLEGDGKADGRDNCPFSANRDRFDTNPEQVPRFDVAGSGCRTWGYYRPRYAGYGQADVSIGDSAQEHQRQPAVRACRASRTTTGRSPDGLNGGVDDPRRDCRICPDR